MFCFAPDFSGIDTFDQNDSRIDPLDKLMEDALEKGLEEVRDQSIFPIGTESTSFEESHDNNEFQNIDIKVQILGLMNGLIMEATGKESKKIKSKKSKPLGEEPIFAVVSGFSEVPSKKAIVATHLPSLELEMQASSPDGKEHSLMAVWPADFDPDGNQTSSVTFTRKMKTTTIDSLAGVQKHKSKTCMYTTENLILAISLRKGKEIITLGTTMVHFTGEEKRPIQTNLPLKTTKHSVKKAVAQMKGEKIKKKNEKSKRKLMKPVSFKSDPSRSFYLGEDSVISMLVQSKKSRDEWPEGNIRVDKDGDSQSDSDPVGASQKDRNLHQNKDRNDGTKKLSLAGMMTPSFITQEDILLDLAISDELVSKDRSSSPFRPATNAWDKNLLTIPSHSYDSSEHDVKTPVKEILVLSPNNTPKAGASNNDLSYHPKISASDSYVSVLKPSATDNYLLSSKSNDRPRTAPKEQKRDSGKFFSNNSSLLTWLPSPGEIDQTGNQCLSTRSSNIFAWMPTPKDVAQKFNFANFDTKS